VKLGDIDLEENIREVHEFSIDRTGNSALDTKEIFRRMWERSQKG
jgi:hypothetical protein